MYPPYRWTASIITFSAGSTMARASSGSRSSINSIEPLMSAKRAVTVLRSPSVVSSADASATRTRSSSLVFVGAAPKTAPHESQNFASGRLSAPHEGHDGASRAPHLSQNFAVLRLSVAHLAQCMSVAQLVEQGLGVFQIGGVEALGEQ